MANRSLVKKLKIKPGHRIVIINPPMGYVDELGDLPEGAELATAADGQFDVVHLFTRNSEELEGMLPKALQALKENGRLWISFPKRVSGVQGDLTRDKGWGAVGKTGLEGVTLISINDTWSAMGFRVAPPTTHQDVVAAQYAGRKAALKPIYNSLVQVAQGFGIDMELAPRKTYVGLVRKKVFGVIKASTSSRIDLGLKLKDGKANDRLLEAPGFGGGSITHKVALTSVEDVDGEVISWMRKAYDGVG